jgi:hypothetical protein
MFFAASSDTTLIMEMLRRLRLKVREAQKLSLLDRNGPCAMPMQEMANLSDHIAPAGAGGTSIRHHPLEGRRENSANRRKGIQDFAAVFFYFLTGFFGCSKNAARIAGHAPANELRAPRLDHQNPDIMRTKRPICQ